MCYALRRLINLCNAITVHTADLVKINVCQRFGLHTVLLADTWQTRFLGVSAINRNKISGFFHTCVLIEKFLLHFCDLGQRHFSNKMLVWKKCGNIFLI